MSFNARKAAQTIAYFVLKSGTGQLNVLKAVKLVYLADRESIKRYCFPIQDGDLYCSMPHGPVNSKTYSHINGEYADVDTGWDTYLESRAEHCIALATNDLTVDDLDELSEADLECLDEIWAQFGLMNQWKLRDWTHERENIPEWEDPNGSSRTIPLERILTAQGVENSGEVAALERSYANFDTLFASLQVCEVA